MITLTRGQIGKDTGLDVSSRSTSIAGRMLAPKPDMVIALRKGRGEEGWPKITPITEEMYIEMYYEILKQIPNQFWNIVHKIGEEDKKLLFLCKCTLEKKTCHTEFLINYMINRWPNIYKKEKST